MNILQLNKDDLSRLTSILYEQLHGIGMMDKDEHRAWDEGIKTLDIIARRLGWGSGTNILLARHNSSESNRLEEVKEFYKRCKLSIKNIAGISKLRLVLINLLDGLNVCHETVDYSSRLSTS